MLTDPVLEAKLLATAAASLGFAITILVVIVIATTMYINYRREKRREKHEKMWRDLMFIADGNLDLVRDAIRHAANGGETADLEKVVQFISANRDTYNTLRMAPA